MAGASAKEEAHVPAGDATLQELVESTAVRQSAAEAMRAAFYQRALPTLLLFNLVDLFSQRSPPPKASGKETVEAVPEGKPAVRNKRIAKVEATPGATEKPANSKRLGIVLGVLVVVFLANTFWPSGAKDHPHEALQAQSGESVEAAAERLAKEEELRHPETADKPDAKIKHAEAMKLRMKMMDTAKQTPPTPSQ